MKKAVKKIVGWVDRNIWTIEIILVAALALHVWWGYNQYGVAAMQAAWRRSDLLSGVKSGAIIGMAIALIATIIGWDDDE